MDNMLSEAQKRAGMIFRISLMMFVHRLRYDFIRELVVGFCSVILFCLFYYIFNDFLNEELARVSETLRMHFIRVVSHVINISGCFLSVCAVRNELKGEGNIYKVMKALGEDSRVILACQLLKVPLLVLCFWLPLTLIRRHILEPWPLFAECLNLAIFLLLPPVLGATMKGEVSPHARMFRPGAKIIWSDKSPFLAMVMWRVTRFAFRNPYTRYCLVCSVLVALSGVLVKDINHPILFLLAFSGGFFLALGLILQVSSDLECSWFEKNLGVSHDHWLGAVMTLSFVSAFALSSLLAAALGVHQYLSGGLTGSGAFGMGVWHQLIKLAAVFFIPPFMVPFLCLQIDGRRVLVQVLTVFLSSLFVATAVYASLFSLLILPLIAYYGIGTQRDRFYRA